MDKYYKKIYLNLQINLIYDVSNQIMNLEDEV